MDERARRLWSGAEALSAGHGGVRAVQQATGLSRPTIVRGKRECAASDGLGGGRIRAQGRDESVRVSSIPTSSPAWSAVSSQVARGDPESPLRWTSKSARDLAAELTAQTHRVGKSVVCGMLHGMVYSPQANRKTREGSRHPDRNAQFEHINAQATAALKAGLPVISVDT